MVSCLCSNLMKLFRNFANFSEHRKLYSFSENVIEKFIEKVHYYSNSFASLPGTVGLLRCGADLQTELCAAVRGDLRHLEADEGDVRDELGELAEGGDAEL